MVTQHSKKNKKYIIYSTFQKGAGLNENVHNYFEHLEILDHLKIPYKKLEGFYKGKGELSILREFVDYKSLHQLRKDWKQDTVLLLENHKHGLYNANLIGKSGKLNLGYFRQVSKEIAFQQENYTIDGVNHYICTKTDTVIADELFNLNLKQ